MFVGNGIHSWDILSTQNTVMFHITDHGLHDKTTEGSSGRSILAHNIADTREQGTLGLVHT